MGAGGEDGSFISGTTSKVTVVTAFVTWQLSPGHWDATAPMEGDSHSAAWL